MKKSVRMRLRIGKNRWKNRGAKVWPDYFKALTLLAAVFVTSLLYIYGYTLLITSPYFLIKGASIQGCRELTEKEVLALAAIKPSQTLFCLNMKAVAHRIAANSWVKKVTVGRELPNRLIIQLKERQALAICRNGEDFFLVDTEGAFFKRFSPDEDDADLPVLTGFFQEGKLNQDLLNSTLRLLKQLALKKQFPTLNMVSEINGNAASGLSLFTDNGFCLKLGFDNYEMKLQRLLTVITALNKMNYPRGYLNIDLMNMGKIYVERRTFRGASEPARTKKGFRT